MLPAFDACFDASHPRMKRYREEEKRSEEEKRRGETRDGSVLFSCKKRKRKRKTGQSFFLAFVGGGGRWRVEGATGSESTGGV